MDMLYILWTDRGQIEDRSILQGVLCTMKYLFFYLKNYKHMYTYNLYIYIFWCFVLQLCTHFFNTVVLVEFLLRIYDLVLFDKVHTTYVVDARKECYEEVIQRENGL